MISALLALSVTRYPFETTTFVREMAKCSTPIQIVYSGEKSKSYADELAEAILLRRDYNSKKTLSVKTAEEYEAASHPTADFETVVALVSQEELSQLPPKLGALFGGSTLTIDSETCNLFSKMTRVKAGQITFNTLIQVPMSEDLKGAMDRYMTFSTQNWRDLKIDDRLKVNRVSTSGTNVLRWIPTWGALDGNIINTVAYRESEGQTQTTSDQVFFWNRSLASPQLPEQFRTLAETIKLNPLTLAAIRQAKPDGHYLSLFIAPSEKGLEYLATRYPNVNAIGDPGFIGLVNDLRASKRSLVIANGIGVDRDVVATVGGYLDTDLRDRARLGVLQRGSAPDVQSQDLGNPDVVSRLKSTYGVRWVFVMELSDAIGSVDYQPEYQCQSNLPAAYSESAPAEPERHPLFGHRKTDEEWAKAQAKYRQDLAAYKEKKNKYEYEDGVQWKKMVVKRSSGQAHLTLKLIDLEENSRVVWRAENTGKVDETVVVRTELEMVRGHMRKPRAIDCPRPEPNSPLSIQNAGAKALSAVMKELIGQSLLPSEDVVIPIGTPEVRTIAVEPPIITINAGQAQGVKIGDRVVVEIFRDIIDPNTKEVIERVSIGQVTLEVIRVGKTSDCRANNTKDVDLMGKIKIGDLVQVVKA